MNNIAREPWSHKINGLKEKQQLLFSNKLVHEKLFAPSCLLPPFFIEIQATQISIGTSHCLYAGRFFTSEFCFHLQRTQLYELLATVVAWSKIHLLVASYRSVASADWRAYERRSPCFFFTWALKRISSYLMYALPDDRTVARPVVFETPVARVFFYFCSTTCVKHFTAGSLGMATPRFLPYMRTSTATYVVRG